MVQSAQPGQGGDDNTLIDRRRPGRVEAIHPELIPLLRHPLPTGSEADALRAETPPLEAMSAEPSLPERILRHQLGDVTEEPDDLRAATGVLVAIAISIGFWVACYTAMGLLVHV